MAFNFSFNFGYLTQTGTYRHNADASPSSEPGTTHVSPNLKVQVYPTWFTSIRVEWTVPADWGRCLFNVFFSPSQEGPFQKLNPTPIDGNALRDIETEEISKFNRGFYKVEATLLDQNNALILSVPVSWGTYQNNWVGLRSTEIQRREWLLLRRFVGVKTYLFRKRAYGQRCPECWNPIAEKAVKDNCTTCLGTTFKGGYFEPSETLFQYDPTPNANMKTYFGVFEPNQIGAWTVSFPEIYPDDVVVRAGDWSIYRVDGTTNTELQANAVRQIMKLTQLAKQDIENDLFKRLPEFKNE